MMLLPPRYTLTYTLLPYTTLSRAGRIVVGGIGVRIDRADDIAPRFHRIDRAKEIGRDRRVVESGIAVEFAVTVVRVIGPAAADTALDPEGDLLRLALRVEAAEEGVAGTAETSEGGLAGIRELLLERGVKWVGL